MQENGEKIDIFSLEDAAEPLGFMVLRRENAANQHLYTLHSTPYTLHRG